MRRLEPIQSQNALSTLGEVVGGGAAHGTEANHDGIERSSHGRSIGSVANIGNDRAYGVSSTRVGNTRRPERGVYAASASAIHKAFARGNSSRHSGLKRRERRGPAVASRCTHGLMAF